MSVEQRPENTIGSELFTSFTALHTESLDEGELFM